MARRSARSGSVIRLAGHGLVITCIAAAFTVSASAAHDATSPPGRAGAGQTVEPSLTPLAATLAADFTSSLVNTVNMAAFPKPSPDPSGLTYLPATNTLLMTDGEIEEEVDGITHFLGANVWELTLGGSVVRTSNISHVEPLVFPLSDEPAGVAVKPSSGHCFVSDDSQKQVYDVDPGADGSCATGDDSSTLFSTLAVGNTDPGGIAYDSWNDRLFIADGTNSEIFQYTTAGALVGQFDVEQFGALDPETVEFNSVSGTLFVLSNRQSGPIIIETSTSGALLQTIDVSVTGAHRPSGLAYAPASAGSGQHFYILDRGIDNNSDPNIIDGKMFELTAPVPATPVNAPPVVGAGPDLSIGLPAAATLDGSATDDGNPAPASLTATWSQVSGPSIVNFANPNAAATTASVSIPGTYVVRLTGSDGEFTVSDEATLTFTGTGSVSFLNVPVGASSDDAEQLASTNGMRLANADLDMMVDAGGNDNIAAGLRFAGLGIPQGATITHAYVQFEANTPSSVATTLTLRGQAADNAPTFASQNSNITLRPTTAALATWSPDPWLLLGELSLKQRTPNLAGVVQEVVSRPGWVSSNALVLTITGSGQRSAEAWDSNPVAAPLLHVEWTTGGGNAAPVITSDAGGPTAPKSVPENQTPVTDVNATDADAGNTLTYSITAGADMNAFTIVPATGVLTFLNAPNFELPTDIGLNNVYDVTVTVSDGNGGFDSQAIAVTVTNVNEFSPVITSNDGGDSATVSVPENQSAVTDVNATDGDLQTPTYSISGGPDAARFTIVPASGVLTFTAAPNFEAPTDVGGNNIYDVVVQASDGSLTDTQAIAVTVTDVVEGSNSPPTITSNGGGASAAVSAAENQTAVTDVNATDPDPDTLTFSITGADVLAFTIVPATGVLTFLAPPDFELPTDVGLNNVYDVTVTVSDGNGGTDSQTIAVTVTDVNEDPSALYFSLRSSATVGGVSAANEDIVSFDGTSFSLYFDGSNVGLASFRIDAFSRIDADTLLLSLDTDGAVLPSIVGTVDDSDIIRFDATSLGQNTTAGSFSMYFDGSDVGLTASAQDVDAAELLPSGQIVISTSGSVTVPGVSAGRDEDLLIFTPTSLGDVTAGSFAFYFDGSDVGLGGEDVDAAAVDASGNIYLSVTDVFAVSGVSGDDEDVFVFAPTSTGATTAGDYSSTLYFDGSVYGLAANDVFAIDLP